MFSIVTPSEVRVAVPSGDVRPASDVVRIGRLLLEMDTRLAAGPRPLEDRPPVPGVVVAPSPNARRRSAA